MEWITKGFEGFSKGTMENGGQNLYVSKKGILQRIFQYDLNLDGHPDLLFGCSQSMGERPPLSVYTDPLKNQTPVHLPTNGTYDGCLADLHNTGFQDLVVACQSDGQHSDIASVIYFGSEEGLTEKYKLELPAPNAKSVCCGDFNGDGKQEILFVSNGKLRMFFQREWGFGPSDFVDYDFASENITAADLDGDGFCDIAVKNPDGKAAVIFGTRDGLDIANPLWLETEASKGKEELEGSTAGSAAGMTSWRPCVISLAGKQYLFAVEWENANFFTCSADRKLELVFTLNCPGVVCAAAADVNGDGYEELALAAFKDRDQEAECRIYLGTETGIGEYSSLSVKGCVSVTTANLDGKKFIFCRTGERIEKEVPCPVVTLDADNKPQVVVSLVGGDCGTVVAGRPQGGEGNDTVVMMNHMFCRGQGHEDVYVYLGGEDGYIPERKMGFPGHSAVGGAMVDFFDSGSVDVLVDNCFEDAAFMDDGSYIYVNDGNCNFPIENKVVIPTVRGHGSAIGDFRKSGYLDIASGGFRNRELRIFHGSEKGYSLDNCTKIVFGPETPDYKPPVYVQDQPLEMTDEEKALTTEFGEIRWMLSADLNGDGWLDLFVSEIIGPRCYILWGGPEGYSKERMQTLYTDGVASATVADLTGNGYPDLMLAQHMSTKKNDKYESYVTIYWGGPEGYKENRRTQLPVNCANSCTVGDYSGQGKLDLYAVAYRTSRCRDIMSHLYFNDGKGNFSVYNVKHLFQHSASGCVSGDFNGDGYTDLAIACHKEYGNHCSHSFIFWGGPDGLSNDRKTVLPTTGPHGMTTVDPGNILDRGPRERYTSEVKELPQGETLKSVTWEGVCTSTSWVEVEVRAAASAAELENAQWITVESGENISKLGLGGFVQYRLALCADCACGTPRIEAVRVISE